MPGVPETPPPLSVKGVCVGFRTIKQLGGELPEGYREAVLAWQRRQAVA